MKRLKKIIALILCSTTIMLLGCPAKRSENENTTKSDIVKPSSITVMWDDTIVAEDNGGKEFVESLEYLLGMEIKMIRPEPARYYDTLKSSFILNEMPEVFVLSAEKYSYYASQGVLWNMEEAWNNSELKKSGRMEQWAIDMIDGLKISGKDGAEGIYGFKLARGNGCVTYVRTEWLETCGYNADGSDIKTFDDYYNMCVAFKDAYNKEPVAVSRYIAGEAPYTHFLPEFYQDAYPDFYKNEEGKWVDGFSEQAMKDALKRLQDANNKGLLDSSIGTSTALNSRDAFYIGEHGIMTYFAGTWGQTLADKLAANGQEDPRVTALKPIAEVGKYVERQGAVVVISAKCENPEGVFKYFIEPIYDGGDVQILWTYGVKGVHWDDKAETITLTKKYWDWEQKEHVTKNEYYTYAQGEFHFLLDPATNKSFMKKNYMDPLYSMAKFIEGKDPATTASKPIISEKAMEVMAMFNENSRCTPVVMTTSVTEENKEHIWEMRNHIVTKVISQNMNVDEAMEEYEKRVGDRVRECLDSLNTN